MGETLDRNCFDTWIADDDLIVTVGSSISLVRSFDICLQKLTYSFDFPDKVQHDLLGPAAWALRLVQAQTLKRQNRETRSGEGLRRFVKSPFWRGDLSRRYC